MNSDPNSSSWNLKKHLWGCCVCVCVCCLIATCYSGSSSLIYSPQGKMMQHLQQQPWKVSVEFWKKRLAQGHAPRRHYQSCSGMKTHYEGRVIKVSSRYLSRHMFIWWRGSFHFATVEHYTFFACLLSHCVATFLEDHSCTEWQIQRMIK